MNIRKSPTWLLLIGGIDLVLILATALTPYVSTAVRDSFLHHFNLAIEMNLATWWESACLLLLALLAYELFSRGEDRHGLLWLGLSLAYVFFSLDELGSLHERFEGMGALGNWGPLGEWGPILFIGGLIGILHLLVLVRFYPRPETRGLAVGLMIGFVILSSVPIHEFLEHALHYPAWAKGIRAGLEEGSELAGIILILWQLARYRQRQDPAGFASLRAVIPNPFAMKQLPFIAFFGFQIHAIYSLLVGANFDPGFRGDPAIWLPAGLFIVLFCASSWKFSNCSKSANRLICLGLSALFLLDSVLIVYLIPARPADSLFYALGIFSNIYVVFAVQSGLIALALMILQGRQALPNILGVLMLIPIMLFGLLVDGIGAKYVLTGLYSLFLFAFFLTGEQRPLETAAVSYSR